MYIWKSPILGFVETALNILLNVHILTVIVYKIINSQYYYKIGALYGQS